MRDSKNVTAVCDEPAEVTADQVAAAQRTVAANAVGVEDATELMLMLGIHPSQEEAMSSSTALPRFV